MIPKEIGEKILTQERPVIRIDGVLIAVESDHAMILNNDVISFTTSSTTDLLGVLEFEEAPVRIVTVTFYDGATILFEFSGDALVLYNINIPDLSIVESILTEVTINFLSES